ncbi:MAG TPA: metallophosphoesterase [Thermoanaerobaculia bacterium]|nr:metallophosphoesterase [Thermoanaerobaculia bacterium]
MRTSRAHRFAPAAALALGVALAAAAAAQMPALKPLQGTPALGSPKDAANFTFVVAGDNRPPTPTPTPTPTIVTIFDAVKGMQPQPPFVVLTGDIIYGKDDKDKKLIEQEYQAFLKVAGSAGVTVYNAPGNHEMNKKGNQPSATMQKWYEDNTGAIAYGAFSYGNSRFIALNTDDLPGNSDCTSSSGKPAKGGFQGYLSPAQLAALKTELDQAKSMTNVFVFMHRPIYADKKTSQLPKHCRDTLRDLFSQYPNLRYVIASHRHLFYQPTTTKPPPPPIYLISGGAGAPLAKGGFYNYLIFTVAGDQVSYKMINLGTGTPAH